jgi:serine/threonine-protein kinase
MFQPESAPPLGGRYQIIQQLGVGGFGQTFLAQDLHLPGHPRCVVKQLRPQVNNAQELQVARRLFDTEAQVLYRLGTHPQIPSLLAHFEENQEFYLAQELIEGNSLEEELANQRPWQDGEGMVEDRTEWAITFLHDLLSTLAFVHDHQVIHRDIKPSNLIRRRSDSRIVLIDFGAVKQVSTQLTTALSSLNRTISIGTEGYMPSEQMAGRPQFSSDVYAVGMIAIQGLTGRPPHTLPTHPHSGELDWHGLASHGHPSLIALLDYMVQYDFRSRYATAVEALAALQETFPQPTRPALASFQWGADYHTPGAAPSSSRAVQTVAVGRRPQPATSLTATAQPGPGRLRQRTRQRANPLLPLGLGLVALLGLGTFAWRAFLTSPTVETISQETDAPADVIPALIPEESAPTAPLEQEEETPPAADPQPVPDSPPESLEPPEEETSAGPPPESVEPEPEPTENPEPEPAVTLTPDTAQSTVSGLYSYVSNQSWDAARGLLDGSLAQQFDPGFFEQFQQVTVDNLRVTSQTNDTVELIGRNTYYYPDGSQQQEERTFQVRQMGGQPRIVGSEFVQVLRPRGGD